MTGGLRTANSPFPDPQSHYPAKPDSRGIAQDAERLERKGGHDDCFGVPGKAWKVSPLS